MTGAASIEIAVEPLDSPAAQWRLDHYFAELASRFEAGFDPAQTRPASIEELTPPAGYFLVARRDGRPVGCGALKVGPPGVCEIKRTWIAADARGRGLGRTLLGRLEALASRAGAARIRLETNRALKEAQALYRSEGYREVPAFNAEPFAHLWFEKEI